MVTHFAGMRVWNACGRRHSRGMLSIAHPLFLAVVGWEMSGNTAISPSEEVHILKFYEKFHVCHTRRLKYFSFQVFPVLKIEQSSFTGTRLARAPPGGQVCNSILRPVSLLALPYETRYISSQLRVYCFLGGNVPR